MEAVDPGGLVGAPLGGESRDGGNAPLAPADSTSEVAQAVIDVGPDAGLIGVPSSSIAEGHLVLSYVRPRPSTGFEYRVESSVDLSAWESTNGQIKEQITQVDAAAELVEAVYLVPLTESPVRFMRLRVVPTGQP